ncbi:unnamed protein product [Dicrocoelium dendriticum]|nr:unnamed protein product [Dicrocoelium dendriticum]
MCATFNINVTHGTILSFGLYDLHRCSVTTHLPTCSPTSLQMALAYFQCTPQHRRPPLFPHYSFLLR